MPGSLFLVLLGERQGTLGGGVRFLYAASHHLCLPQREMTERLIVDSFHFHCYRLFPPLDQQRHGIGDAP